MCKFTRLVLFLVLALAAAPAMARDKPRLVVVISVDQFSAILFNEWRGQFTGGLKTLSDQGIVYSQAYQSHAATETCPGHSTLLTGAHPAKTGIAMNDWLDRDSGRFVYCYQDDSVEVAGVPDAIPVSPRNLRAETVGDWLKRASPKSRLVSVAGKDRAAIGLGGHNADALYWYAKGFGFTTFVPKGSDQAAALSPVSADNDVIRARLRDHPPVWTYAFDACRAREGHYTVNGADWPATLPPPTWKPGPVALATFLSGSPYYDEIVLGEAEALMARNHLGEDADVDLLTVGLSGTDHVGHRYGTQGPEMCDQLLRLDRLLGGFLERLKARDPNVLVVLSADHGGSDFAERTAAHGYPEAHRVDGRVWIANLNAALRARLDREGVVLAADPLAGSYDDPQQLYVRGADGRPLDEPTRRRVIAAALEIVRADPEVAEAHTLEDAIAAAPTAVGVPADELSVLQRMGLSAVPDRSGDILIAFHPLTALELYVPGKYIAYHGSPYDYDRRVPIIFWRPGQSGQERPFAVDTTDIAPTIAVAIGLEPPQGIDGRDLRLP